MRYLDLPTTYSLKIDDYEITIVPGNPINPISDLIITKSGTMLDLRTTHLPPETLSMTLYKLDSKGNVINHGESPLAMCQQSSAKGHAQGNLNVDLLFAKVDKFRAMIRKEYTRVKPVAKSTAAPSPAKVKEVKNF